MRVSKSIEKVTSARIELGYHNFYRYRWAGRADSAAVAAAEATWLMADVGTTHGTDREAKEWVCVLQAELPTVDGLFTGGRAEFRLPSWAPPSSPQIARWSCRLILQRSGRDLDEYAQFTVAGGAAEASSDGGSAGGRLEHFSGSAAAHLDISLARLAFHAGETIDGAVTVTPTRDLPDGDVGVCWQRYRYSHPLTRTPSPGEVTDGRIVQLGKRIPLRDSAPVRIPFTLALPGDAEPTASAIHSSLAWFVQARMFYAGFARLLPERARRQIVLIIAPEIF